MDHYPLMIDLKNKKTVVVGGGKVALRKIRHLLRAEADIVVVSPESVPEVGELEKEGNLIWRRKAFTPDDLFEAFLAIAATDSQAVNESVARTVFPNQLVSVVDNPKLGNFLMPSVLDRGRLTVSVSTGGASPALACKIRDEIAESYDESFSRYVDFLHKCREMIKCGNMERREKEKWLKQLLNPEYRDPARQRETLSRFEELRKEGAEL